MNPDINPKDSTAYFKDMSAFYKKVCMAEAEMHTKNARDFHPSRTIDMNKYAACRWVCAFTSKGSHVPGMGGAKAKFLVSFC